MGSCRTKMARYIQWAKKVRRVCVFEGIVGGRRYSSTKAFVDTKDSFNKIFSRIPMLKQQICLLRFHSCTPYLHFLVVQLCRLHSCDTFLSCTTIRLCSNTFAFHFAFLLDCYHTAALGYCFRSAIHLWLLQSWCSAIDLLGKSGLLWRYCMSAYALVCMRICLSYSFNSRNTG